MGILNKKQRIIDTYLTPYGRKKLAEGNMNVAFIAATDRSAQYIKNNRTDTRDEDFIEMCNESAGSYQDQIFFDSSNITSLMTGQVENEIVYLTGDFSISENGTVYNTDSSSIANLENFVSTTDEIINDAFVRIKNKKYLKNKQESDFKSFEINKKEIEFKISNSSPISNSSVKEINVTSTEPFFFDRYISSTDNFKFLPPVLPRKGNAEEREQLGNYTDLNQKDLKTFDDIEKEIERYPFKEIEIIKSSRNSNIVFQMFGIKESENEAKITKLDTIDFGEYYHEGSFKKVIFAGKVFIDNTYNYPTYSNIFTIVMEE
jgi:hypothetical protein